jgi:hypothetical protein
MNALLLLAALAVGQPPPALSAQPMVYSLVDDYGRWNQSRDPVYLTQYVAWVNAYHRAELAAVPLGHIPGVTGYNTRSTWLRNGHWVPY